MNVNKIYKLIKNAVCLQCRKDHIETACHGESVVQIRDNGDRNLVQYVSSFMHG